MSATILVVEDEPSIQELIAASLQHAGHRVMRADTAEDAIRLVNSTLPDVVLIDCMPAVCVAKSGLATCRSSS